MLHVVKFSGGAASAVVAKIVADANPGKTVLLYHDTKTEPADNDRFRREVAEYVGLPITDYSDGRDIWQVFEDEGFLGNQRMTPCTKVLKQQVGDAWIKDHLPCTIYLGYTMEEWRRAQRMDARIMQLGAVAKYPLIEQRIGKDECLHRVTSCWKIALPKMYEWAEHANCVPCVKGGLAYWGMVHLNAPAEWERAALAEEATGEQILKSTRYGTLREELPHCLELAGKWMEDRTAKKAQLPLLEQPCECAA